MIHKGVFCQEIRWPQWDVIGCHHECKLRIMLNYVGGWWAYISANWWAAHSQTLWKFQLLMTSWGLDQLFARRWAMAGSSSWVDPPKSHSFGIGFSQFMSIWVVFMKYILHIYIYNYIYTYHGITSRDSRGWDGITWYYLLSVLVFPGSEGATFYGMFWRAHWDSLGIYGYLHDPAAYHPCSRDWNKYPRDIVRCHI